jgi:hypothetical protein
MGSESYDIVRRFVVAAIPGRPRAALGRPGSPVAGHLSLGGLLASAAASYLTDQTIVVDGGATAW